MGKSQNTLKLAGMIGKAGEVFSLEDAPPLAAVFLTFRVHHLRSMHALAKSLLDLVVPGDPLLSDG